MKPTGGFKKFLDVVVSRGPAEADPQYPLRYVGTDAHGFKNMGLLYFS